MAQQIFFNAMRDTRSSHASGARRASPRKAAATARVVSVARMVSPTPTRRLMARDFRQHMPRAGRAAAPSFDEPSLFEAGEHGLEEQILSEALNEP